MEKLVTLNTHLLQLQALTIVQTIQGRHKKNLDADFWYTFLNEVVHYLVIMRNCNDINRLSKPLQSRFRKIFLPKYSEAQFLDISERVLTRLSPSIARYIGAKVYRSNGDVRDVLSIGRLIQKNDGPAEVEQIMDTMPKYAQQEELRK